jgi:hypothetical protein
VELTAAENTTNNIAAKMPMMAMTVSSSTSVNAGLKLFLIFMTDLCTCECGLAQAGLQGWLSFAISILNPLLTAVLADIRENQGE